MVIMPIGYIDVVAEEEEWQFTRFSCYYHEYMNVNYDGHLPLKHWYECFYPHRAYEKALSYYIRHKNIVKCDSLGREKYRNLKDRKEPIGANDHEFFREYTAPEENHYYINGNGHLIKNLKMLKEKGIDVVLVSPPHYWADFQPNKKQVEFLHQYIASLQQTYSIRYIDMQFDKDFVEDDYYNETHLSEFGAEKFTKKLDKMLFTESIR